MMFHLVVETAAKVPFNTVYCKVYESGKFPFSWLLDWMERALSVVNHTGELESCYQASLLPTKKVQRFIQIFASSRSLSLHWHCWRNQSRIFAFIGA